MTRTGDWEIRSVSGRLPDNPGELACMLSSKIALLLSELNSEPSSDEKDEELEEKTCLLTLFTKNYAERLRWMMR